MSHYHAVNPKKWEGCKRMEACEDGAPCRCVSKTPCPRDETCPWNQPPVVKPRVYRHGGYWYISWPPAIVSVGVWLPLIEWVERMNGR